MSMDVMDPMGGQRLNPKPTKMTMRDSNDAGDQSSWSDDSGQAQPSYSWRDRTMNQVREQDDPDGDLKPGTEGPGQPPL